MNTYLYLVHLDCGHQFLRQQTARLPRPRLGAHEKCLECGQIGAVTAAEAQP